MLIQYTINIIHYYTITHSCSCTWPWCRHCTPAPCCPRRRGRSRRSRHGGTPGTAPRHAHPALGPALRGDPGPAPHHAPRPASLPGPALGPGPACPPASRAGGRQDRCWAWRPCPAPGPGTGAWLGPGLGRGRSRQHTAGPSRQSRAALLHIDR